MREILWPNVWLLPVTRIVTGQDPVRLHDSLGKSWNSRESSLTARYWGSGTWSKAGHLGGLGIGQLKAWSNVEYWTPHSVVPLTLAQPHLYFSLFNSLSITRCKTERRIQSNSGNTIRQQFARLFRFCNVKIKSYKVQKMFTNQNIITSQFHINGDSKVKLKFTNYPCKNYFQIHHSTEIFYHTHNSPEIKYPITDD